MLTSSHCVTSEPQLERSIEVNNLSEDFSVQHPGFGRRKLSIAPIWAPNFKVSSWKILAPRSFQARSWKSETKVFSALQVNPTAFRLAFHATTKQTAREKTSLTQMIRFICTNFGLEEAKLLESGKREN